MRCNYCEWGCELTEDTYGVCKMYHVKGGMVQERFPNRWSSCSVTRIESIPFYHAYPGSRSLIIGTMGCNFRCRYCSNGFVVYEDPGQIEDRMLCFTPKEVVGMARKMRCDNIVFNVNEPTVSLPSLLKMKPHAQAAGIEMGCLTNGYTTPAATEMLLSVFDFFNVGLKGFSSDFYRKYIGVKDVEPVLRNIEHLAGSAFLEVTTPVIQDVNDMEIEGIVSFLSDIDADMPWHVFRLLPEHDMKSEKYPNIDTINAGLKTARRHLSYVYFHNFVGSEWVNTDCPACGFQAIQRFSLGCGGDRLMDNRCPAGVCSNCGHDLNLLVAAKEAVI